MDKVNGIYGFFGPFRFLSNFHYVDIEFEGLKYRTTEHAYQAAKSLDPIIRQVFAHEIKEPKEARYYGQQIELTPDWDTRKLEVMLAITREKYKKDPLRQMLLDTKDWYLEETNTWKDVFWGVCNGVGQNNLGKTLMQVRDELSR